MGHQLDLADMCWRAAGVDCGALAETIWYWPVLAAIGAGTGALGAAALLVKLTECFREWRTAVLARKLPACAGPTAQRIEAATRSVLTLVAAQSGRARGAGQIMGRSYYPCADEFSERDWLNLLLAGTDRARMRALKRASPRLGAREALEAFEACGEAIRSGQALSAHERGEIVAVHLRECGHVKAALVHACRMAEDLREVCAAHDVADRHIARLFEISRAIGCRSGQGLAALLVARRAVEQGRLSCAREALAQLDAAGAETATAVQIAAADLSGLTAQLAGNFARARDQFQRRAALEQRAAANRRGARAAKAHFLADIARIELLETVHTTGKRVRAGGRRAERLLSQSVDGLLACREAAALALVYTRLAMAAVLQRRLGAARAWAKKGRGFAQATRAFDLVAAADDLLARIEAEREARRSALFAFSR